jgi:hypothetical protein
LRPRRASGQLRQQVAPSDARARTADERRSCGGLASVRRGGTRTGGTGGERWSERLAEAEADAARAQAWASPRQSGDRAERGRLVEARGRTASTGGVRSAA